MIHCVCPKYNQTYYSLEKLKLNKLSSSVLVPVQSKKGYVKQALEELKHIFTGKHHFAPSKLDRPDYGAKIQFAKIDKATPLSLVQIKHIERVVGKFLYYARAIDNTMLHALNNIASSKSKGTQTTSLKISVYSKKIN